MPTTISNKSILAICEQIKSRLGQSEGHSYRHRSKDALADIESLINESQMFHDAVSIGQINSYSEMIANVSQSLEQILPYRDDKDLKEMKKKFDIESNSFFAELERANWGYAYSLKEVDRSIKYFSIALEHSKKNPNHEERVRKELSSIPNLLTGAFYQLSSMLSHDNSGSTKYNNVVKFYENVIECLAQIPIDISSSNKKNIREKYIKSLSEILGKLGESSFNDKNYNMANERYQKAIAYNRKAPHRTKTDFLAEANLLRKLRTGLYCEGTAHVGNKSYQAAIECYQKAIACIRRIPSHFGEEQDFIGINEVLAGLKRVYILLGNIEFKRDFAKAIEWYEKALACLDKNADDLITKVQLQKTLKYCYWATRDIKFDSQEGPEKLKQGILRSCLATRNKNKEKQGLGLFKPKSVSFNLEVNQVLSESALCKQPDIAIKTNPADSMTPDEIGKVAGQYLQAKRGINKSFIQGGLSFSLTLLMLGLLEMQRSGFIEYSDEFKNDSRYRYIILIQAFMSSMFMISFFRNFDVYSRLHDTEKNCKKRLNHLGNGFFKEIENLPDTKDSQCEIDLVLARHK